MRLLELPAARIDAPLRILCLGAHCDDVEIGCGATLLRLAQERPIDVTLVTLCSDAQRAQEARRSMQLFLSGAQRSEIILEEFRDGFLPAQWGAVKERIESLKSLPAPDLIFTHERDDRHQDHRLVSELTWNTFRDHTILEYEIPKFDGGLNQPNLYTPVSKRLADVKVHNLLQAYVSQRSRPWFTSDAFLGLMRVRGVESNAAEGYAEAFHARKIVI